MSLELTPIPSPLTIYNIKKNVRLESKKNVHLFLSIQQTQT